MSRSNDHKQVSGLPMGWTKATIRETIKIIDYRGRTPPYSESGIPHLRSSNVKNGKIVWEGLRYVSEETYTEFMTRGFHRKDDILFTTEAPLGEVALAPEQSFSLAQRLMILQPPREEILPRFLMYQIQSETFQRKLRNSGTGTTVKGVSSRNFQPISILIAPFKEQYRIVDKIEELFSDLDDGIKSLKTAQQQLKVYRQAVLKWAFEGKLTAEWRAEQRRLGKLASADALLEKIKEERSQQYQKSLASWAKEVETWETQGKIKKKPRKPKKVKDYEPWNSQEKEGYVDLPTEWRWTKIGLLGDVQLGRQRSPKNRSKNYPTKYIRAANITEEGLNLSDVLDMEFVPHEKATYELRNGDIVLSEASGSPTQVGKPAIWLDQIPDCCFQNTVIRLRSYVMCNEYILWAFKDFYSNGVFADVASGVGINHLSASKFAEIAFPVAPIDEQQKIIEEIETRFSICDRLQADITTNLKKAEALRQSILKQAFEGKLVPQDPSDEPASVLLARIRAEKAPKATSKKEQRRPDKTRKKSKETGEQLALGDI